MKRYNNLQKFKMLQAKRIKITTAARVVTISKISQVKTEISAKKDAYSMMLVTYKK